MSKEMTNQKKIYWWKPSFITVTSGLFFACWMLCYRPQMRDTFFWKGNLFLFLVYAIALTGIISYFGGFGIGVHRLRDVVYSQSISIVFLNAIVYIVLFMLVETFPFVLPLLCLTALQVLISTVWMYCVNRIYFRNYCKKRTVLLYSDDSDVSRIKSTTYFEEKYELISLINNPVDFEAVLSLLPKDTECIFITRIDSKVRNELIRHCLINNIQTITIPDTADLILNGSELNCLNGEVLLNSQRKQLPLYYSAVKRGFDIFASSIGIIVLSPLMLVTAFLIMAYDGGPAFYKQNRLTKDGKEFWLYKFRSMRQNAESDGVARLATQDDDRITPIGRFIRATRIDEIPQLINIIKGDMSVVGPRPERPEIASQYEEALPEFALRLQVQAGLTGYAQVYGKYNTEPAEKLRMDLLYINTMSIPEDIKLILTTIKIVFTKEATEGVSADKTTAIN